MGTAENKDIVRRVYEEVVNNHNLDLPSSYLSPKLCEPQEPWEGWKGPSSCS
jgi:hypothetical protein